MFLQLPSSSPNSSSSPSVWLSETGSPGRSKQVQLMVSEVQLQNDAVRFHTSARLFVITCFFRKRTFFKMYLLLDCGVFIFLILIVLLRFDCN